MASCICASPLILFTPCSLVARNVVKVPFPAPICIYPPIKSLPCHLSKALSSPYRASIKPLTSPYLGPYIGPYPGPDLISYLIRVPTTFHLYPTPIQVHVNLRPTAFKVPLDLPLRDGSLDAALTALGTGGGGGGGRGRGKEEAALSPDHELQAEMTVAPQVRDTFPRPPGKEAFSGRPGAPTDSPIHTTFPPGAQLWPAWKYKRTTRRHLTPRRANLSPLPLPIPLPIPLPLPAPPPSPSSRSLSVSLSPLPLRPRGCGGSG